MRLFGEDYGKAQRWIDIGSFSLQPSEIAQIAMIVFLASYLDARSHANLSNPLWLLPPLLGVAVTAGFLILNSLILAQR